MSNFFNKNLLYLRKLKKISQQQLADKLGIDRSTISKWETGDYDPTVGNVISIANVLGVPIADLVGRDIQEEDLYIDDLQELYNQGKDKLTEDDKDTIKFIIEKRMKDEKNNN